MALVDYPSSEDGDGDAASTATLKPDPIIKTTLKRKRIDEPSSLPPLPSKFHDLYASTTRVSTSDNPALHGGRKRVIPHIEGNWPTHLYIEWYPSTTEYDVLSALILSIRTKDESSNEALSTIHPSLTSDLDAPLPLHISLSRSLGFTAHSKDQFLASLEQTIKSSGIRPFDLKFTILDWVPNFEKTRWFLVLRLEIPSTDGLNKLLHVSNKVVQDFGQPPLYVSSTATGNTAPSKQPGSSRNYACKAARSSLPKVDWTIMQDASNSFHVSIAWTLEAPSKELLDMTRDVGKSRKEELGRVKLTVEEIKTKIGNVVTGIPLSRGVVEGKGAFEF